MNEQILSAVVSEIAPLVADRPLGRIIQLSGASVAMDFRLPGAEHLFISVEPARPRLYLINRRVRDIERSALAPSSFLQSVRKHFAGARLRAMWKETGERIVHFDFAGFDQIGVPRELFMVAQLTGRSAELFALDENKKILATLRVDRNLDFSTGDFYRPPLPAPARTTNATPPFERGQFNTLSEAADNYYQRLAEEQLFRARAGAELARLRKEIAKRRKLQQALQGDLAAHGDAEEHQRLADLILANLAGARRRGNRVTLLDYYAEGAPEIEIEVDENSSLQEEATRLYQRYGKSKRAAQEINRRLGELAQEIAQLEREQSRVEKILAEEDYQSLRATGEHEQQIQPRDKISARKKREETYSGLKRYRSSDGYEVLVGRGAQDNDRLTFRVARPHDLWLHTADYPGAHVVIVNHDRHHEVPHRTIIEAAQLAAHHSQARADAKVNVNYAQRKHLSKPRGAAPGLVRMSNFRTLLVEPRESIARI